MEQRDDTPEAVAHAGMRPAGISRQAFDLARITEMELRATGALTERLSETQYCQLADALDCVLDPTLPERFPVADDPPHVARIRGAASDRPQTAHTPTDGDR